MELKIEYLPIDEINPYPGNAKQHPIKQINQIAESIQEFGFNDPIAISNGMIAEGHGRLLAAQQLGLDTVPVIRLDALTDEQRRAYTLIHNQLTINSGFDLEILSSELENITDIDMSDFDFQIEEMENFSIDDIQQVNGYDANHDDSEYFTASFIFPISAKENVLKYLRKHKQEITEEILQKAKQSLLQ